MDGLLAVDKPAGWTSHDAVAYMRRALGVRKAGHTGTLDPAATGLLLVLLGKATRLARYFEHDSKEYFFVLALGSETDTLDGEGKLTSECTVPELTQEGLEAVLEEFRGEITQVPPMYSAVKVGGRALYALARAGEEVERNPRTVTIHDIGLVGLSKDRLSLKTICSKGTYIRTLGNDIAHALGSCGHIESLRRISSGGYSLEGAVDLASRPGREELERHVKGIDTLLQHLPSALLKPEVQAGVLNGRQPTMADLHDVSGPLGPGSKLRLMGADGRIIAVARVSGEDGKVSGVKLEVVVG